ncbi:MAG TPA: class I SAM-dependent methyltransferase [Ramlibacter sp.]|jgi:ubiquinone/menaquinone biosynthesis C-methylase UbiE|nr:class I SAM-dependent methyltransferase [Ramlibacter sp.]
MDQAQIDAQNAEFWNTLCGTGLAQMLGITDGSEASLKKFDDWYLDYYPYLLRHVPVHTMKGEDVLEIGLGYGTLSQKIAEAGARYRGLDIASGPVKMVNDRMEQKGLDGKAVQGNMLKCPFPDQSFDVVVSIGCFHHTGDTQRCLDETFRVLRPGGRAFIMLYNRFSIRQWQQYPKETRAALWRQLTLRPTYGARLSDQQRADYDADMEGRAAPETQFFSARDIKGMMKRYRKVECYKENCDHKVDAKTGQIVKKREDMLDTVGKWLGLDIYVHAVK